MTDSYPESFEIEIEHEKLYRYWRRMWTLGASMPCLGFGVFVGFAAAVPPKGRNDFESAMHVVTTVASGAVLGLAAGTIVLLLIHALFIRRFARREADALFVAVEGPFLRVKEGVSCIRDRKLHFRAIIDYAYYQDSHMRECKIGGLELNTISGGTIRLRGIKDALEVRDLLSKIDAQRENLQS